MMYCYDKRDPQGAEEMRWEDCTEEEKIAWADDLQARDVNRITGSVRDLRRVLSDQEEIRLDYQNGDYGDFDGTRAQILDLIETAIGVYEEPLTDATEDGYKEDALYLVTKALEIALMRCEHADVYRHLQEAMPWTRSQS